MKVQGKVKQTVEGTITTADLLALIRETFHIPEDATARFYTYAAHVHQQMLASPVVDVGDSNPLRFTIEWPTDAPSKQG